MPIPESIQSLMRSARGELYFSITDLASGEAFEFGSDQRVPAASTIKVPILAALAAAVEAGKFHWDTVFTLTEQQMRAPGAGVLNHFRPDQETFSMSLYNLAVLMIIVSDNAATNFIIKLLGYDVINRLCTTYGMRSTSIHRLMQGRPAGVDQKENWTSMADLVHMYRLLHERRLVSADASELMLNILGGQQFFNRMPRYLGRFGNISCIHKTGTIPGHILDAGIIETGRGAPPIIFAASAHNWPDSGEAEEAIARLALHAIAHFLDLRPGNTSHLSS